MPSDADQTTPPLAFSDLLLMDAIRRENNCEPAICAYEAGCVCWREFIAERGKANAR